MRQSLLRIATIMIAAFLVIGAIGAVRTQSLPSLPAWDRLALFLSGPALSKLEIAGSREPLENTLRSRKAVAGPAEQPDGERGTSLRDGAEQAAEAEHAEKPEIKKQAPSTDRKIAFIYHSHNRESWLPELPGGKKPNEAFDAKINVTLLGERLQRKLEEGGVGAVQSKQDYNSAVPAFNYNYSYKYSLTSIREAMAIHSNLAYLFDIHRDSQPRENTTVTINGKDYAKLYFIIGEGNKNWEKNEAFAKKIHQGLEAKFPGLSKGILSKSAKHGHGEYNQSLSPSSVLIEIGGVGNTLEESSRTVDALASVLTGLILQAEKTANQE